MRSAYDPARGIVATPYVIQDDTTHTVTAYDESGAVTATRPYTADENAAADAAVAQAAAQAQYEAQRLTVRQIITDLQAEKARAQAVIDTPNSTIKTNPAPYVVDVARAAKRIADAAIDLARYVAP